MLKFRKLISFGLVAMFIFMVCPSVLSQDEFNEYVADFSGSKMNGLLSATSNSSKMQVANGELEITLNGNTAGARQDIRTSGEWDSFLFQTDFMMNEVGKTGETKQRMYFTSGSEDITYKLSYSSEYSRWYLAKNSTSLGGKGYAVAPNQWYTIKIMQAKGKFSVEISKQGENKFTAIATVNSEDIVAAKGPITFGIHNLTDANPKTVMKVANLSVKDPSEIIADLDAKEAAKLARMETDQPLDKVTITVGTKPRQTFKSFGFGFNNAARINNKKATDEIFKMLFDDIKIGKVRIWFAVKEYLLSDDANITEDEYSLDKFIEKYGVGSGGCLDLAAEHNFDGFLLAPSAVPEWMKGEVTNVANGKTGVRILPEYAPLYGQTIARAVYELRTKAKLNIVATGLHNEPDGVLFEREMCEAVKACRKALDEYGLYDVKIIAPELANNDGRAISHLSYAQNDDEAWNAMDAFSTHSYNMAVNKAVADMLVKKPKDFWQTESSTVGPEEAGNYTNAVVTTARILNDLNHMVTDWFYFIGYLGYQANANGTRMITVHYDTGEYIVLEKYYYIKHLLSDFDYGMQMRLCTSDKEGEMDFTYGRKKRMQAAAGVNPDGTWTVGLVNNTNTEYANQSLTSDSSFNVDNATRPSQPLDITVKMPGLAHSGEQEFKVKKTAPGEIRMQEEESIIFKDGVATIHLEPYEFVTLRSVNPIEEVPVEEENDVSAEQEETVALPDKPDDMTDEQYMLWIQGSVVLGYDMSKLPPINTSGNKKTEANALERTSGAIVMKTDKPYAYLQNSKTGINGDKTTLPVVRNGVTMVPVRFLSKCFGVKIEWDTAENVTVSKDGSSIVFKLGENAVREDGTIMLPLRAVADMLGKKTLWIPGGIIIISDNENLIDVNKDMALIQNIAARFEE